VLFRVRMNPESHEEELQQIGTLPGRAAGMVAIEQPLEDVPVEGAYPATLLIACETGGGIELIGLRLEKLEDPETLPPAPVMNSLGRIGEFKHLGSLTADLRNPKAPVVWGGEGRLGGGETGDKAPRLARFTLNP